MLRKAFLLPIQSGNLFAVFYDSKKVESKEAFLFVPPFADEMNKSRRMISLQAKAFQAQGHAVLILDLFGTGDSSGDFSETSWEIWKNNLNDAWLWLKEQGYQTIHFWGIRLGCLLALDTAQQFDLSVSSFIFWQPVTSGERFVTQLLRLRIAEKFGQEHNETVKQLRESYVEGNTLEIAGYTMPSKLLSEISKLQMGDIELSSEVIWMECSVSDAEILPGSLKVIEYWRSKRVRVKPDCVQGRAFWNSVEIEEVPHLIERTCAIYQGDRHAYN